MAGRWLIGAAVLGMFGRALVAQPPPLMAAGANPGYEVATIKPSGPDERRVVQVQGVRLVTADTSLVELMMFAYGVHSLQVTGGPEWVRTEKFDVLIQPDMPGRANTVQMRSILRKLLADRFKLTLHHAQKELPVYAIVVAKNGAKLEPVAKDEAAVNTATIGFGEGVMTVRDATMSEFASLMQRYVGMDRPVVDKTGIAGKYDFTLKWTPDSSQFEGTPPWPITNDINSPPGLYTAIQEQLGLKLQAMKTATDVLVIDGVEQPSDN